METEEILKKIFAELQAEAYDAEYHNYNYKYTNQIIRANIEELMKAKIFLQPDVSINEAIQPENKKGEVAVCPYCYRGENKRNPLCEKHWQKFLEFENGQTGC